MSASNRQTAAAFKAHKMPIHALWAQDSVDAQHVSGFARVLNTLSLRFNVSTAMLILRGDDNTVVKVWAGQDPLEIGHAGALHACQTTCETDTVFVMQSLLETKDDHPSQPAGQSAPTDTQRKTVDFYAGAPLLTRPGGKAIGVLCLFNIEAKAFGTADQAVLASLAMVVSAALVMPHDPAAATVLALASAKSVLLLGQDQAIEAINPRFEKLSTFSCKDLEQTGVQELLCLDRGHGGAMLLNHALLADTPACAMTRCLTRHGGTVPVEVFIVPLRDLRGRTVKTVLLLLPLFSGPIEDFLLSLRASERDELLSLHIAGLWALDTFGRILKLSGTPIAHLDGSSREELLGKLIWQAGVFDTHHTDWHAFDKSLLLGRLPADIECCVTHGDEARWYSMKGFQQTDARGVIVGYHGSFLDITSIKQRELSLKKSEERLSLILKGTNDGAWDWDMETGQYYLSPRWWDMMGRPVGSETANAEIWMDFIHPDDKQGVRDIFRNAMLRKQETYQFEFRMLHQRGHYIPVLGRGQILCNSQGKAIRTSGTNVDLTPQRQAQAQIRLLQSCVESLQDVVIVTHASPRRSPGPIIAYVNPAFEAFTGYSRDEALGKTPRLLQGPETSRKALEKIVDAMQRWQPIRVELLNYKKNGESFWAELNLTPVQADGSQRFTHWIGVQRDVTQRKHAQQTLNTTTQRLSMAIEASNIGSWTLLPAKGEAFRDERWYAMLGYPPAEQTVSITDWLGYLHPDDVPWVLEQEKLAADNGDIPFEKELRMRHRDGHWVWIQSRGRVIDRDAEGKPTLIAGTHIDISNRVKARVLADRLNAQLSRCLEHLNVGVLLQRNGIIRFVNSTLLAIFGNPPLKDIIGTPYSKYILVDDVDAAVWRQQQLLAGAKLPAFWFNCIHADGHVFKAMTSSTVVEWEGEPHILSTMTPPSDVAMLAQEIEASRVHYENLLAEKIEEEQTHIAHELHDSLGSQLAAISLLAGNIRLQGNAGEDANRELDQLQDSIKEASEITRTLARGLAPVDAWPGGFWRAVEKLCNDFSVNQNLICRFVMEGNFDDVPHGKGKHLYRITQEAISNSVRHGGAQTITVHLLAQNDNMLLQIEDDGQGFDVPVLPAVPGHGMGLSTMYARARAIDANIMLKRLQPQGFCVEVSWQAP